MLIVVAVFTVLAALLAWSRWLAGRHWAAAGHLLLAAAGIALVASVQPLSRHVETYETWTTDHRVAELFFERVTPGRYRVTLTRLPQGRMQVVDLTGSEWRLELRTLAWSERAQQLGLRPRYRIERLVARSGATAAAGHPHDTAHQLTLSTGPAPWLAGLGARRGRPLVTETELAGPWRPMADRARFDLRLSPAQVVEVTPVNTAASESLALR